MDEYEVDEKFINLICELRGKVIQTCIDLEMIMDAYIAEHFCESESKVAELASIVLVPRVQWREKLAIFTVLIERYNQSFKDEFPDFDKDIINTIEHRNVFAHLPADVTSKGYKLFLENGIVAFFKFKNTKMPKTKEVVYMRSPSYTNEKINGILKGIHTYTVAIKKLLKYGND
jgi:hypothetical protein